MKQHTCCDGNNLPTQLRSLSKWPWYSFTVPIYFNLVKSPKLSSNSVGPYLAYNPSLRLAHVISSSNFSNWYQSWASPSGWYAARKIHFLFGIFWDSKNCSYRQIQLVGSFLPLKHGKSNLVTLGIKVPPDLVEP